MNNIYKKNKRKAGRIKIRYDGYEYIRNFKKENFTNWNKTMALEQQEFIIVSEE